MRILRLIILSLVIALSTVIGPIGPVGVVGAVGPLVATQASMAKKPTCSKKNKRAFVPVAAKLGGLPRTRILALPRTTAGVPSTPPLTDSGKRLFAWDRPGIRPASGAGHVLLNAHVWPDGTALGDTLNAKLRVGNVIKVRGKLGRVQCYRVVKRVVATPSLRLTKKYYGTRTSKHRLAIITCSGTRLGPGNWTHRTVWFAKPTR